MITICDKLPSKKIKCVAAIGTFDGIHPGHRFILKKLKKSAARRKISSLVISFNIAPTHYLGRKHVSNSWKARKKFKGYITDVADKISLIGSEGIDYLWLLKTSRFLLRLPAEGFVAYIKKYFDIKEIIIGGDFRFGYKGRGNAGYLADLSRQYGFKVSVVNKRRRNKKIISSSLVRSQIAAGRVASATKLLGRDYLIKGRVVKGRGIGRTIGFPTANISLSDYILPSAGVYAAWVYLGSKRYLAAANIGRRPTITREGKVNLEAHIINFKGNILHRAIKVAFLEKIRNERKFASRRKLKAAISRDVKEITAKCSARRLRLPQPLVP